MTPVAAANPKTGSGPPPAGASPAVWNFWLRFHETDLCQGLDTVFVFGKAGIEVWCRIEEERAFERFSELIAALRSAYEIAVYATRPVAERKLPEDTDPPPSLWNNNELRIYLQDPFLHLEGFPPGSSSADSEPAGRAGAAGPGLGNLAVTAFKQRMILFANQTLDWARRMNRCAGDLPGLVDGAFAPGEPKGIRARAKAVCLAHAEAVDKYAEKLGENLAQALPKAAKKIPSAKNELPTRSSSAPREIATLMAGSAGDLARRIRYFIYPVHFTVELTDLRAPSLLESLSLLRKLASAFPHSLNK